MFEFIIYAVVTSLIFVKIYPWNNKHPLYKLSISGILKENIFWFFSFFAFIGYGFLGMILSFFNIDITEFIYLGWLDSSNQDIDPSEGKYDHRRGR